MNSPKFSTLQLILILAAALAPIFLFATKIDADELVKSSAGTVFAATTASIVAIVKMLLGKE